MAKISLSRKEKSIDSILNWYEDQVEALRDLKNKIVRAVIYSNAGVKVNPKFLELTIGEIDEYFENSEEELNHLVCFDLISATEALLRVDYYDKISKKDKSPVGREFRVINKKKRNKVSLEDDIVTTWKTATGDTSFSNFLGLLKYRHWLAHGRYWQPKLGRQFSVDIAYEISENIYDVIAVKS